MTHRWSRADIAESVQSEEEEAISALSLLAASPSIEGPARSDEDDALSHYAARTDGLSRSHLNWRRGCFRLWIVGSALFFAAVVAINFSEIKTQLGNLDSLDWTGFRTRLIPTLCSEARGAMGKDFTLRADTPDTCWYELPSFRLRYPELSDRSDAELEAKLYAAVGRPVPLERPAYSWMPLLNWAGIAVGVPLVVLILGAILGWALSGFKASTSRMSDKHYRYR
jgi:hypothetical protein